MTKHKYSKPRCNSLYKTKLSNIPLNRILDVITSSANLNEVGKVFNCSGSAISKHLSSKHGIKYLNIKKQTFTFFSQESESTLVKSLSSDSCSLINSFFGHKINNPNPDFLDPLSVEHWEKDEFMLDENQLNSLINEI